MKTILKYPLEVTDAQKLWVPTGASPLCVQMQNGTPALWILADTACALIEIDIRIVGTGHDASGLTSSQYLGTVQQRDGALVWHVFMAKAGGA